MSTGQSGNPYSIKALQPDPTKVQAAVDAKQQAETIKALSQAQHAKIQAERVEEIAVEQEQEEVSSGMGCGR